MTLDKIGWGLFTALCVTLVEVILDLKPKDWVIWKQIVFKLLFMFFGALLVGG